MLKKNRILFVSWHFYLDNSNGASISARELLLGLRDRGWDVKTLCGPIVDNPDVSDVFNVLKTREIRAKKEIEEKDDPSFTVSSFNDSGIRSVVFYPSEYSFVPQRETGELFLSLFASSLDKIKPDIIVTYGGSWLASKLLRVARKMGVKTVFMLQNFAYNDKRLFNLVDLTIVPSRFAADAYKRRIGIETVPVPPLIRREDVVFDGEKSKEPQKHVLYVNPSPNKGVFFFVKMARELWKKRPDIPFLVVEGCSTAKSLAATGADLSDVKNIKLMEGTTRPSSFYRYAKITVVPSLFEESFGRVVAESAMNGVPVIGSTRGAIPETTGQSGTLLEIDSKYQPKTKTIPTADDVAPWIDEIIKLWDDSEYYAIRRRQCLQNAQRWDYTKVLDEYVDCLARLLS